MFINWCICDAGETHWVGMGAKYCSCNGSSLLSLVGWGSHSQVHFTVYSSSPPTPAFEISCHTFAITYCLCCVQ